MLSFPQPVSLRQTFLAFLAKASPRVIYGLHLQKFAAVRAQRRRLRCLPRRGTLRLSSRACSGRRERTNNSEAARSFQSDVSILTYCYYLLIVYTVLFYNYSVNHADSSHVCRFPESLPCRRLKASLLSLAEVLPRWVVARSRPAAGPLRESTDTLFPCF